MLYGTREPLTEKLLSCYRVKGFSSLLVCSTFTFCRVMTFIRYIGVDFKLRFLDCVRYNEDFLIWRFFSTRFTVTLSELKNIARYSEDFAI